MASVQEAICRASQTWRPPPSLTVSEWADAERRLSSESSAEPGQWRTDRAPYQRGIMDAVCDPAVHETWVMKSAQVGWTEILNNVIGYHVDQDPAPMLLVQPSLELAEAWSKDRLAPMIRDTPALQGKIADPKARDSGNTLLHKSFTGGRLTIAGANAPRGLASRPIRIVMFDEVDGYPTSAGTEGDPISLGVKRTRTFWNRKVLAGSTPTIKGSSRIEVGFEQSDQRFYFVPCTHCGEYQRLIWANVRWPDGRPHEAVYVCQHCGVELTDADKPGMLARGEWRSSRPFDGIAGFHISELYSPWSTWAEMASGFLRAKRLPETLQTWINTSLGETWEDAGETLEPQGLLARREAYTRESLPPGVLLITAGTDVQGDRLETTIWGWGADEEAWRVEHVVLKGDPASAALWAEHDQMLERRYALDDGRELGIEACAVDSGGHFTEQVCRYAAKRKSRRVWAIKGIGGAGKPAWPKTISRAKRGAVHLVGVDTAKDVLYQRVRRVMAPGPGYVHLDAMTDAEWVEQFISETVVHKVTNGRRVRLWRPRQEGSRQEALDCTVYAWCALQGRGGAELLRNRARQRGARADVVATPGEPVPVETFPEPERPKAKPREPRSTSTSTWVRPRRGSWFRR
jgi:phage terminase large subunit GpA-like protein